MRVLTIHNDYGAPSGEEIELDHIQALLEANGHIVREFRRSSAEIGQMRLGKMRAFFMGIHNPASKRALGTAIREFRPDLAFVQNLFPLISPSVLRVCRQAGVPVVMRVANYRLMCPNGLHFTHGKLCERCLGGREYWCALKNCEDSVGKSLGYAIRSAAARISGAYCDNVSAFLCASQFLRGRLIAAGFDARRIHVVPNAVPDSDDPSDDLAWEQGDYVGYVGRLSREKGVPVIISAARRCPNLRFLFAGRRNSNTPLPKPLPPNVQLLGHLAGDELDKFYRGARIMVSASECFETFGLSVAEAMLHGKPVVVSRIGVFPEFVDDGVTGLLFRPGDDSDLAEKIRHLWERPDLCRRMGEAGRTKVLKGCWPDTYYERFMKAFGKAMELGQPGQMGRG